jgi:type IV pilus assembly protein PilQ
LKTFISESGKLSANPSTGNILVVDFESNIKVIDNFIKEIDRLMQQVLVEVRIYDVTYTENFDIEVEWDAGRNNPITTISNTKTINELTGTTTADVTTETTSTAWQHSDAGVAKHTSEATKTYTYRKSKPFVGGSFNATSGGTIRLGFLNDAVNIDIALSMLHKQVEAKLLANPRILVLDNETAEFKIISEIPYQEVSETSEGGSMTGYKFKEVGVKLVVTPHITRDGMIRLNISPEFSVVVGTGSPPTVDKRIVNTKALVKDGQTVVIGGLRKREVSQDIRKVPLLGDIPLLGGLFTRVDEEVKTNELFIFITPTIVAEPTLSANELKGLKATEFGGPEVTYAEGEKAEKEKEKIEKKQPSKQSPKQPSKQPLRQRYPSSVEELKRALAPSSKP